MNNPPDGFIGAVMAVEGIDDGTVLLHGQNGCRKGLLLSQRLNPRPERLLATDSRFYAGSRTVPYSGIDGRDYTGDSKRKLEDALRYVSREDYRFIAVMCSPGVSIIGDDCADAVRRCGLSDRAVFLDEGFGGTPWEGFDSAVTSVLKHLDPGSAGTGKDKVNVLGLSIMHKDWQTVKEEITYLLSLMGLEAVCFPGAGCTTDELKASFDAEYNIILDPDYCARTAAYYGKKTVSIGRTVIGFDAVYELLRLTGKDMKQVRSIINRYRSRAYDRIIASGKDLAGMRYRIEAPPSLKDSLSEWLEDSFSMIRSDDPDVVFCDGMTAALNKGGRCIDIGFPSPKVDFTPSPVLGLSGAMYILESLFG